MPNIDATFHGQLLLHQFLAGIPGQVSRQLWAMGNATDLQWVVEKDRLLMSIDEQHENAVTPSNAIVESTLGSLQTQNQDLTQLVAALATRSTKWQSQQPAVQQYFNCNQVGNLQHQCPRHQLVSYPPHFFQCGRIGHFA